MSVDLVILDLARLSQTHFWIRAGSPCPRKRVEFENERKGHSQRRHTVALSMSISAAYCLMPNHVHLIAFPQSAGGLGKIIECRFI